ncbi:MAG: LemA family protein [Gammaproteobacteria bacterium]|nr:LemA family protein [Gammaproteobacteria bacterium]
MPFIVVLIAAALVIIVYCIGLYNGLVALRQRVRQAWANIDVLLKQRHDELPKLIETCKRYMQYEQETLERVIRARNAVQDARSGGDVGAVGAAEQDLRGGLGRLFGLVENYPELKADQSFQALQVRISGLEDAIADRRELYNEQVQINNTRIEQFPAVLIARRYGFQPAQLLEFAAEEKGDVDVGALLKG